MLVARDQQLQAQLAQLCPPPLIERIWCLHLLQTRSYAHMCTHLVPGGSFIHHTAAQRSLTRQRNELRRSVQAYHARFQRQPPPAVWDTLAFSFEERPAHETRRPRPNAANEVIRLPPGGSNLRLTEEPNAPGGDPGAEAGRFVIYVKEENGVAVSFKVSPDTTAGWVMDAHLVSIRCTDPTAHTYMFDGARVHRGCTMLELEMVDGDCLDVIKEGDGCSPTSCC
ncbi:MAG: hypothetical protein WDW38_000248 [Sanguina aurantia]